MREDVKVILSLSGDDFRNVVLNNAGALAYEVKDLDREERQRLAAVVQDAWPANGVRANVERDEHEIRFLDRGAHAWLTLAPALDISPTPSQWADLATSGAVMSDTSTWLGQHYSEEAALLAARSCDANATRPWAQLIGAIPADVRLPDDVVVGVVAHLSEPGLAEADFELWQIGDRFVREGRLDALQELSAKSSELARRLRPWRARLGETKAARLLIEELTPALEEGRRFDRDEANWLEGVRDPALLPHLFEALAAALSSEGESPFGVSSVIGRAIYRIGGDAAVRMYDELIGSSEDSRFKFLRIQRDEIVQAELRAAGQLRAREISERLELPTLDGTESNFDQDV